MSDDQTPAPAQVIGHTDVNMRADVVSHPRRVFIDALKTFFAEPNMLGGPNPYRWSPERTKSKIVIAAEYSEDQAIKNPNHMILVNRGPIRTMRTHMRNLQQERVSPILPSSGTPPDGTVRLGRVYSAMLQTDIQIVCFSHKPAEAEQIAQIVFVCCLSFQDYIKQQAGLHRIENPTVGNESPVQSSDAQIMLSVVPVTVPIYLPYSWQVVREPENIHVAPILTQVDDC